MRDRANPGPTRPAGPAPAPGTGLLETGAAGPAEGVGAGPVGLPGEVDTLAGTIRLPANWVFGYGSLIWHPDFDYAERHLVRVYGYHRAFCINSTRYRGTPEAPGVVLGLDRGGSCHGVVYRIQPGEEVEIVERLYQREMPNHVYTPRLLPVRLGDGRNIEAITFVARRDHHSYMRLSRAEILRRLSSCRGGRGHNREYAINTWRALREWGIEDAGLGAIARDLEALDCPDEQGGPDRIR